LTLADVDVLRLLEEANVPAQGCAAVFLGISVSEEERQLERVCEADKLKLGSRGKGFGDVPAIESPGGSAYKPSPERSRTHVRTCYKIQPIMLPPAG
jgi:hypothetical protein